MTTHRQARQPLPNAAYRLPARLAAMALLCAVAAGCRSELQARYGQRSGPGAARSVNGTAVLGEMFEQAGHKVFSWRRLSPVLQDRADCIVWFPDDFQPPKEDARRWLEDWLYARPGRTLIYVGRDFDAAAEYWQKVEAQAPPGQIQLIRDRKSAASKAFLAARKGIPDREDCDWFVLRGKRRPRPVRTLQGPWSQGIDPSKVEIELSGRIEPPPQYAVDVLLESDGEVLVSSESWGDGLLLVVANGSFLLNLPLVNHEHRKLAGRLIETVGPPGKTVVFLESGAEGPPIGEEDPPPDLPSGIEIVLIVPICWIFLHLGVVGVAFCFSRWPIFGIPRRPSRESTSDFGKHVRAMADLLQRAGDQAYATTRLLHYRQTAKEK